MILQKVSAEKVDKEPETDHLSVKRVDKYEIIDLNENKLTLKLFSNVFVEPEALFCIFLEYAINYEFIHNIDKKFVENNIDELLHPLGGEVSYMTSTLSKMFTNTYFVMPPSISIEHIKN